MPANTGRLDSPSPAGVVETPGLDVRRAEEALERERSLLASVMQATDVMLVYLDPDFNFVWVNEAYAATCRMRPQDMVGKNHFALYPHAENEAIFRRVRDTGERVFYRDKPFEFPDQPERGITYWDWSLTPVKDAGGIVAGLVFSLRETTRYKRAELALSDSEARYRLLFHNMLHGFAYCRMLFDDRRRPIDFICLDVNDSFVGLTGLKDVAGKRVTEVIPGIRESNPELFDIYGRVASSGRPERFETYLEPLGIWFSIAVYSPQKDHFVAVFDNITARKRGEEELKRSRQGLSRLAEASLQVMRETDLQAMLQAISAAALELTGARIAVSGHGYASGQFGIGAAARAPGTPGCLPDKMFVIERGGVYMDLMEGAADTIRLSDEQLRAHPR